MVKERAGGEMVKKRQGQVAQRFLIYFSGLLIMALGIVLLIKADLGATPWDVFHVGLYQQFGLTIGSWSVIVGIVILSVAAVISKEFPQFGAFLNMILVGVFIDMYLMIPFLSTPQGIAGKILMFSLGVVLMGYGIGLYISASFGTGPRDSLMMALTTKMNWKIRNVRGGMELGVLLVGWQLGGPISWGTFVFTFIIGPVVGFAMPQCFQFADAFLDKMDHKKSLIMPLNGEDSNRGADL